MEEINRKMDALSKAYNLALMTIIPITVMIWNDGIRTKTGSVLDIEIERQYLGLVLLIVLPIFSIHVAFLWEIILRVVQSDTEAGKAVELHTWWLNPFKFVNHGPNMYGQTASFVLFIIMFCPVFLTGRLTSPGESGFFLAAFPLIFGAICGIVHLKSIRYILEIAANVAPNQRTKSMLISALILALVCSFSISYSSGFDHNKKMQPTAVGGG